MPDIDELGIILRNRGNPDVDVLLENRRRLMGEIQLLHQRYGSDIKELTNRYNGVASINSQQRKELRKLNETVLRLGVEWSERCKCKEDENVLI